MFEPGVVRLGYSQDAASIHRRAAAAVRPSDGAAADAIVSQMIWAIAAASAAEAL